MDVLGRQAQSALTVDDVKDVFTEGKEFFEEVIKARDVLTGRNQPAESGTPSTPTTQATPGGQGKEWPTWVKVAVGGGVFVGLFALMKVL